jgi:hypothetical protein
MTVAVTELPKFAGLTGLRVGIETVEETAALTACELASIHIDSKIKNATASNCIFFMLFHSDIAG